MDFLRTRPFADRNKIGVIGICGSGGFALTAVKVDRRIKAVATVSMYDMSRVIRYGWKDGMPGEQRDKSLDQLGDQRWNKFMNRILSLFAVGFIICVLVTGVNKDGQASTPTDAEHGLTLSELQVKITSKGQAARFRRYDTVAAKEFYGQRPLLLDLTNFRDAQWMFCPPEKLNVTAREAYHDGKKGELSDYAPWGDVFMLYKDFYAGDTMHRLGINLTGIEEITEMSGRARIEKNEPNASETQTALKISVKANGKTTVFELNNSLAARDLYAQLPLSVKVENYSNNEKIFYPPKKLNTTDTPQSDAQAGALAYYAPWGDVAMFYGSFGSAAGLYELGHALLGGEYIQGMSGTIRIEKGHDQ